MQLRPSGSSSLAERPLKTTTLDESFVVQRQPVTAGATQQAARSGISADSMCCLVVSSSAERGQALSWAASQAGWTVVTVSGAASAVNCLHRIAVQLAIVDLTGAEPERLGELREVVETVSRRSGSLLVVSGRRDDRHEERWARQLGVWMYLPEADVDGLELICAEARQIAQRLRRSAPVYAAGAGAWRTPVVS